jgi:hypothetical protein
MRTMVLPVQALHSGGSPRDTTAFSAFRYCVAKVKMKEPVINAQLTSPASMIIRSNDHAAQTHFAPSCGQCRFERLRGAGSDENNLCQMAPHHAVRSITAAKKPSQP